MNDEDLSSKFFRRGCQFHRFSALLRFVNANVHQKTLKFLELYIIFIWELGRLGLGPNTKKFQFTYYGTFTIFYSIEAIYNRNIICPIKNIVGLLFTYFKHFFVITWLRWAFPEIITNITIFLPQVFENHRLHCCLVWKLPT